MMFKIQLCALFSLSVCIFTAPCVADLVINSDTNEVLDVEYTVGNGAQTSYMVVDFGATNGETYAFAYHWELAASGLDMINAVAAGGALEVETDTSDVGTFVVNFSFEEDTGDPDNFWAYHTAGPEDIDPGVDWSFAQVGPGERMLENGSLDGWYNGFDGTEPAVPTKIVPAPASAVVPGVLLFGVRRRRRR